MLLPESSATLGSSIIDGGLSRLLHDQLHWLDVTDRVQYKLAVLMYRSLHGSAPPYLYDEHTKHPTLLVVSICGPPVTGSWSFLAVVCTVLIVGVLLLQGCRPGILCQTVDSLRDPALSLNISGVSWRHTFCKILMTDELYTAHLRSFENALCKLFLLIYM